MQSRRMFIWNAYAQRMKLSDRDLGRLLGALKNEEERYRFAIRNHPPDRMERHGKPFLAKLQTRVAEVQQLVEERSRGS